MGLVDEIKKKYEQGNLPIKLIYLNVAVFLVVTIFQMIAKNNWLTYHLSLSSTFPEFIVKPWTLITYMFLHIRLMHLLFNMLMLWVVGDFFYRYFGDKAFAQFYFIGGIIGGLFYMLFSFIYPQHSMLMGASAAIYAVLFAMVAYQPELRVRLLFFSEPIKLLYVAIGFIV
ncbi:MAG: rhomboid family intramembrane serine protease, partial [Weeksellaceae bacterium]